MRGLIRLVFAFFLVPAICLPSFASNSALDVNLDVKEFFLENGMQFLVVERHATPQVACRISIRAGSALEDSGKTGIAHMLEHMMFKGTRNFGTTDPEKDLQIQNQIETAYQAILKEEARRNPDRSFIREKLREMERLRREVQEIYVPQAFSMHMSMNGAVGINAFTSKDETQYFMSLPSDMMELWFSMVSEQLFEPAWREFYVEKEVVLREWAFRYINNPDGAAFLDLQANAYTAHPYRNPTIGWRSDIERFNTTDAVAFHEKFYNPSNAVCVLVGDITLERAKELAAIYFERYPAGPRAPEIVTLEPLQQGPRKSIRFLEGTRSPRVLLGFHGAPMGSDDFYALDALTMILSRGMSARLNQEIVNKGLATEAWAYNPDNRFGGLVVLGGMPPEGQEVPEKDSGEQGKNTTHLKAAEALERDLLSQVERLKTEPVSPRELERIKNLAYRDFLDRMRSNQGLARMLAGIEVQIGWPYLLKYLERMARVTADDIREAANRYLREDNKTTVFVLPGGRLEGPPDPYEEVRSFTGSAARKHQAPSDLVNRSVYPTPEGWKHPLSFQREPRKVTYAQADKVTLEGATLFYLPDRELPLIDLTLLVKAGEVDVPENKQGLTDVLNHSLIKGGTDRFSPQELAFLLDEKAMRLSVSAREEETVLKLSVMKDDWDQGIEILGEILLKPRFDDGILRVMKDRIVTGLRRQGEDARSVAMREAMIWHFKDHPYGRDPLRGVETVPTVDREALKAFLDKHFVPSNTVVAVSGDIDRQQAVDSLQGFFRLFPQSEGPVRDLAAPEPAGPVLTLIPKSGQVQSQISLVLPGVKRTHPDYWKISMLMSIFGGRDSMLFTRLREDLGLVYATYFAQDYRGQAGLLLGYIGCKGDMTSNAILETMNIMKSLGRHLPEQELERKRRDLLNSFVFNLDTPAQLVEAYARYHMRGEPLDTLDKIQDTYITVQKHELENLAGTFLDSAKLQAFIVVDDGTRVRDGEGLLVPIAQGLGDLAGAVGLPFRQIPLR
jgi:predicted Zn-dependent peptidase